MPGKSHGQRSLAGYSPWGCKESDTTERLIHTHTHTHNQSAYRYTAGMGQFSTSLGHRKVNKTNHVLNDYIAHRGKQVTQQQHI